MHYEAALGVVLLGVVACGGKVVWVGELGDGGGGAGTTSTHGDTNGVSTSSLGACITGGATGGGPLGPNMIKVTKCIPAETGPCPASVTVGNLLEPDPCYTLESVDTQCVSTEPGMCCYDVTEQLVCKG